MFVWGPARYSIYLQNILNITNFSLKNISIDILLKGRQ